MIEMEAPMFDERYAALRAAQTAKDDEGEAFDDHVFACALSAALADQAATGLALTEGLGLTRVETAALFAARFPLRAAPLCLERAPDPIRAMEEDLLRDLLSSYCAHPGEQSGWLAAILARRAMRDDHLWQDLGLFDRGELGRLLRAISPRCTPETPTTCAGRSSSIAAFANSRASACAPLPIARSAWTSPRASATRTA